MHKSALIETFLHKSFRLCSNYKNFRQEIKILKSIFKHNNYPKNFMNQCIKKFSNKIFINKDFNFMVPKRELTFVSPCLGSFHLI